MTPGAVADTLTAPYNDLAAVEQLFAEHAGEIAAVIVEPVAGNMGLVVPAEGFLEGLRALTEADGALLVFDEVMTGFRVHPGGAQELYGITPDLTTLGKVIGGGLPVGAYGGRGEIMELVAPAGPVYQAGTLSGNPLAMTAGIETLRTLAEPGVWDGIVRAGSGSSRGSVTPRRWRVYPPSRHTWGRCSAFSSPSRRSGAGRTRTWPTRSVSPPSIAECSTAASTFRRPSSRPGSCRARMVTRRSTPRSRPPPRSSRLFADHASTLAPVKVLLVTLYFPPAGGGGVQRP